MVQVLDYLQLKGKEYELSREVLNWTRKLEIAEMASRRPTTTTGAVSAGGGASTAT